MQDGKNGLGALMADARKYGSPTFDSNGIIGLHEKVKIGEKVTWLGRKAGKGSNDTHFTVGRAYEVVFIYPSNLDVEIQSDTLGATTRAGSTEYAVIREPGE